MLCAYHWGTEEWGWGRHLYLDRPGRRLGFPEGREHNREGTCPLPGPYPIVPQSCVSMSHSVSALDSGIRRPKKSAPCHSHNFRRRLEFTHLKREKKRVPRHCRPVAMWHLLPPPLPAGSVPLRHPEKGHWHRPC